MNLRKLYQRGIRVGASVPTKKSEFQAIAEKAFAESLSAGSTGERFVLVQVEDSGKSRIDQNNDKDMIVGVFEQKKSRLDGNQKVAFVAWFDRQDPGEGTKMQDLAFRPPRIVTETKETEVVKETVKQQGVGIGKILAGLAIGTGLLIVVGKPKRES